MKTTIGRLFEPLLFLVFLGAAGLMALSPTRRRHYRLERADHRTGCSLIKALRYTSKRAAEEIPLFMPGVLSIGVLPGALLGDPWLILVGLAAVLAALIVLPLAAPVPSVAAELYNFAK